MDDKISHMLELQKGILKQLNTTLGTSVQNLDELAAFTHLLPADVKKLQDLCLFLEKEFLNSEKAQAYFSACLSGAAMIEAFLLLLCWMNKDEVSQTAVYKKHAKTRAFDTVWGSLSFETLIEIAEDLKWIPSELVKADLRTAIALSYEEIAVSQKLDPETIAKRKEALFAHPATALFGLTRILRNCLHAGRWVRQNKAFNAEPFAEWSHLGVILIAEIRDCLVIKFTQDIQKQLSNSLAKFQTSIANLQKVMAAKNVQP